MGGRETVDGAGFRQLKVGTLVHSQIHSCKVAASGKYSQTVLSKSLNSAVPCNCLVRTCNDGGMLPAFVRDVHCIGCHLSHQAQIEHT